ncbi:type VII secretion protein EccE [Amycolatopsis pigmentata]|uniref:Type VII secretion protein EccE n=1 Tax=Amycolatopsis pigmentata TaxID=450801 RepID=A0ABW5FVQ6_9PSEU
MTTAHAPAPLTGPPGHPRRSGSHLTIPGARPFPVASRKLLAWTTAAIAVVAGFSWTGPPARIIIVVLATAVLATTSVRFSGRNLCSWACTWISYRLLQHDDRSQTADPLRSLAHDFRLRRYCDRAGHQFGIAGVGDGWSAVIRIHGEPPVATLLAALASACADTEIPLAGAQLTVRTQGPERVLLLAVRYRPAAAPFAALLRGDGEDGELCATARAALALMATIARSGVRSALLGLDELATELRAALGPCDPGAEVTDGWRRWAAGEVTQSCFTTLGTVDLADALPADAPTAPFTVASYTLWRTGNGTLRENVTVRLAPGPGPAAWAGVPVVPLYGRQASGMRRTMPLALSC